MSELWNSMFDFSNWEISSVDIGVIVGYLLLMMVVGWVCKSISTNVSDYVRMGCKSTWWLMGTSLFMLMTSAGTFTGGGAQAYVSGWSFILMSCAGFFGYLAMASFFAPWMRRTRAVTPVDAVRLRYGPVVEQVNAYMGSLTGMFWGGIWLFAMAEFLAVVFHIPVPTVIIFTGIVVVFYSVSGGSWSVQITDTLQAYILVPIALVVLFLSLKSVGGFGGLLEQIDAKGLAGDYKVIMEPGHKYMGGARVGAGYFTVGWIGAQFIYRFILSANMTACWRFLSCKSDGDARKAAILAGALLFCGSFVWYVPAMVGRVKFEDEIMALGKTKVTAAAEPTASQPTGAKEAGAIIAAATEEIAEQEDDGSPKLNNAADGAYAVVAKNVLPPGLLGLVVIGLFAATMSSLDSSLTGQAGIVTNNLYPPLARLFGGKPWTGRKLLRLTQVVNLLLGIWAITLALILWQKSGDKSVFEVGLEFIGMFASPMVAAMVLSFFVPWLPWWAPLVGMTFGFGCSTVFASTGLIEGWYWHDRIFITMAATVVPAAASSVFWFTATPAYRARVDNFFKQIRTPIDFKAEVGESADHSLMKMIGTLGLCIAGAICILIFFAKDDQGNYVRDSIVAVLFVAGCVASISTIMLVLGIRAQRKLDLAAAMANEPRDN